MARFQLPDGRDADIGARYWMSSLTVVVLLFMAGWFASNLVAPGSAGGAFVTTLTLKGTVVREQGRPVKVLVPATTVVRAGTVITLPSRTINLTQTRVVRGPVQTVTGGTVVSTLTVPTTTTVTLPTTVTVTDTVPTTTTETTTTTVTTTVTSAPST